MEWKAGPGQGQVGDRSKATGLKGMVDSILRYTPVTGNEVPGYVDLVAGSSPSIRCEAAFEIKIYKPGTVKMPDGKEVKWEDGGKHVLFCFFVIFSKRWKDGAILGQTPWPSLS